MWDSGPYYLASLTRGIGYVLQANPAYGQPNCAGATWCEPPPTKYASTANVFWEPTDQVGIQEYIQGKADIATIQTQDTATLLNLEQAGKIGVYSIPTISVFFDPIDLEVDTAAINQYYTGPVHLPTDGTFGSSVSNFLSYVGLRQFLVNAFPYTEDLQQVLTIDGVQLGLNFGGAIPKFLGNYYATNVTWPAGQPDPNPADVGGAAWWWAQANTPSSPYYDPQLAQCTASNPCTFPVAGEQADTQQNSAYPLWEPWVSEISGGRILVHGGRPDVLAAGRLLIDLGADHGPAGHLHPRVAPGLPRPDRLHRPAVSARRDVHRGQCGPRGAFAQRELELQPCRPGGERPEQLQLWRAPGTWTNQPGVPQQCQGFAYNTMTAALEKAGAMAVGTQRTLWFNMASHIANDLALYPVPVPAAVRRKHRSVDQSELD